MSLIQKLDGILAKFNELEKKLQDPTSLGQSFAKISKEHSDMQEVVAVILQFQTSQKELNDIEQMLTDSSLDKEMREMMEEERFNLSKKIPELEQQIKIALLPKDSADEKNAIIEVRAGTGGEEAALFAYKLFHMYQRYAEKNRWKFEILSIADTGLGGYKEASAIITGRGVLLV